MLINTEELKSVASLSLHFPNRKTNSIGVTTRIVFAYINSNDCKLESVVIDRTRYFIVPLADQKKKDWGLWEKLFGKECPETN